MIDDSLFNMNRQEVKKYIFKLQEFIKNEKLKGKDIDTILDETDVFDQFEEILPDNEYPIFVITILNGFNSEVILNKLIDTIEKACKLKSY